MERSPTQTAHGVLAGCCLAAFTQMLTLAPDSLSTAQRVALAGFAVSVPLNAFCFISRRVIYRGLGSPWYEAAYLRVVLAGRWLGLAALTAAFWHFGMLYALLFATASLGSFLLLRTLARAFVPQPPDDGGSP